jgi:hypothetical protein
LPLVFNFFISYPGFRLFNGFYRNLHSYAHVRSLGIIKVNGGGYGIDYFPDIPEDFAF